MMKVFRSFSILCLLLTVGCGDASERTPNDLPTTYLDSQRQQEQVLGDQTIIPGQQLGPVHLGDPDDAVTSRFGTPIYTDAAMGKSTSVYRVNGPGPPATLTVYVVQAPDSLGSGRVRFIRSDAVYYRDAGGTGVGSSRAEVERSYPLQQYASYTERQDTNWIYTTGKGIAFEFGPDDRCRGVVIQPTGKLPGETYLRIYEKIHLSGEAD